MYIFNYIFGANFSWCLSAVLKHYSAIYIDRGTGVLSVDSECGILSLHEVTFISHFLSTVIGAKAMANDLLFGVCRDIIHVTIVFWKYILAVGFYGVNGVATRWKLLFFYHI